MDVSTSYNYLEDIKLHLSFSYAFNRHEPFAGLEFPINSNPVSNFGINLGYKFFPNKLQPGFDLFFMYLMQANSRKLYSNSTINGFSLHNLVGYGFNININSRIFIRHFLAAGIENSWFGENGKFSDLSLMINLGIGVRINKTKSEK